MSEVHTVFLGLGTNLGDRQRNLQTAIEALAQMTQVVRCSSIYQTPPWGYLNQPDFLNQVVELLTELEPLALLKKIKRIEIKMGRQPSVRYGPRLIDMDILFYDDLVLETAELIIPHPRLAERSFVLVPLAELAADLRHPQSGESVREMLARVDVSGITKYEGQGKGGSTHSA